MNPFEQFKKEGDKIVTLTSQIKKIINSGIDSNYFTKDELECIQGQMTDLISQGAFWLEQQNPQRFIYELKNFLEWLIKFVESKESS